MPIDFEPEVATAGKIDFEPDAPGTIYWEREHAQSERNPSLNPGLSFPPSAMALPPAGAPKIGPPSADNFPIPTTHEEPGPDAYRTPFDPISRVIGPPLHGGIELSKRAAEDLADNAAAALRNETAPGLRNIRAFAGDPTGESPSDVESRELLGPKMRAMEAAGKMGATLPVFMGEVALGGGGPAALAAITGTNAKGEVDPVNLVAGLTIGKVHGKAADFIKSSFFKDVVAKLSPEELKASWMRYSNEAAIPGSASAADKAIGDQIAKMGGKDRTVKEILKQGASISQPWAQTPSQAMLEKVSTQMGGIGAANAYFLSLQMPAILDSEDPQGALLTAVAQLGAASVPGLLGLAGPTRTRAASFEVNGDQPGGPAAGGGQKRLGPGPAAPGARPVDFEPEAPAPAPAPAPGALELIQQNVVKPSVETVVDATGQPVKATPNLAAELQAAITGNQLKPSEATPTIPQQPSTEPLAATPETPSAGEAAPVTTPLTEEDLRLDVARQLKAKTSGNLLTKFLQNPPPGVGLEQIIEASVTKPPKWETNGETNTIGFVSTQALRAELVANPENAPAILKRWAAANDVWQRQSLEAIQRMEQGKMQPEDVWHMQRAQYLREPLQEVGANAEKFGLSPAIGRAAWKLAEESYALTEKLKAEAKAAKAQPPSTPAPSETPAPVPAIVQGPPLVEQPGQPAPGGAPVKTGSRAPWWIRPRSDGIVDVLDTIQEAGGLAMPDFKDPLQKYAGEYDGMKDALVGPARLLRRRKGGLSVDKMILELQKDHERIKTPGDLWQAIRDAVAQREHLRTTGGGHEAQTNRFWEAIGRDPKSKSGLVKVNASDLQPGDKFRLRGPGHSHEVLTVTSRNGETINVQDGPSFGSQEIPEGTEFWAQKSGLELHEPVVEASKNGKQPAKQSAEPEPGGSQTGFTPREPSDAGETRARERLERAIRAEPGVPNDAAQYIKLVEPGLSSARNLVGGNLLAKLFGSRVSFFTNSSGREINGWASPDGKTVFIAADNDRPHLAVVGHELLHQLRINAPAIYNELLRELRKLYKDQAGHEAAMKSRGYTGNFDEELLGDFAADSFQDPAFLRRLADKNPGLFRQVVGRLLRYLEKMLARIKGKLPNFGTERWFTDLEAAREHLAEAFASYGSKITERRAAEQAAREPFSRRHPVDAKTMAEYVEPVAKLYEVDPESIKNTLEAARKPYPHPELNLFGKPEPAVLPGQPAGVSPALKTLQPQDFRADFQRGNVISSIDQAKTPPGVPTYNANGTIIKSPADFVNTLLALRSPNNESLKVAILDGDGRVIHSETLYGGTVDTILADSRDFARLYDKHAAAGGRRIILSHNHPSGDPTPSDADRQATTKLKRFAQAAGFEVMDHVITNGKTYYSLEQDRLEYLPEIHRAAWEVVHRSDLRVVDGSASFQNLVASMRASAGPDTAHIMYLSTRNHLVAVQRVSNGSHEHFTKMLLRGIGREAAHSVLLDFGPNMEINQALEWTRRLKNALSMTTTQIRDWSAKQVISAREVGYLSEAGPVERLRDDNGDLFGAPESVAEQKAREQREAKARAAAAKLAEQKAFVARGGDKLTGKDLDTTKEMFGADVQVDKAGQSSLFSRRAKEGEEPRNLVAMHNTTAEKLKHILKIGGLAVPSVAITRADSVTYESFGDISLVGKPDLVTPSAETKVLNTDAYSPRYPSVSYFIKDTDAAKLQALAQTGIERVPEAHRRSFSKFSLFNEMPEKDVRAALLNSPEAELAFLAATGRPVPRFEKQEDRYQQSNDRNAVSQAVFYNPEVKAEFETWLDDLLKRERIEPVEKIFNGYTNLGNRRYLPHTLDRVVKIMKKGFRNGEGFNYGVGSVRALVARQFRTLKAIQEARGDIITKEQIDALKNEIDNEFVALSEQWAKLRSGGAPLYAIADDLQAMAEGGGENWRHLREMYSPDSSVFPEMRAFLEKLKTLPTQYFEAKVKRAVGLHEFAGAVVPEGTDPDLIQRLEEKGLDVRQYPKGDAEARRAAVENLADSQHALFSRREIQPKLAAIAEAENELRAAIAQAFRPPSGMNKARAREIQNLATVKLRNLRRDLLTDPDYAEEMVTQEREVSRQLRDLLKLAGVKLTPDAVAGREDKIREALSEPQIIRLLALDREWERIRGEIEKMPKKLVGQVVAKLYPKPPPGSATHFDIPSEWLTSRLGDRSPVTEPEDITTARDKIEAAVKALPTELRHGWQEARAMTRKLAVAMTTLENRDVIAYKKDAADNQAQLLSHQAAKTVLHELNRAFGVPLDTRNTIRERALTFAIEAGNLEALQEMRATVETSPFQGTKWAKDAVHAMNYAEQHLDRLEPIVELYRRITDAQVTAENASGIKTLSRASGYVFHLQDILEQWQHLDVSGGAGGAASPFKNIRDHATYADSLAAGLNPKTLNAVDLLQRRISLGQKLINYRGWVQNLKALIDPTTQLPLAADVVNRVRADGEITETAPIGYQTMRFAGQTYAIHKGYVGLFKALTTDSNLRQSAGWNTLMHVATTAKHTMLLFDTFHLGRMAYWSAITRGAGEGLLASLLPGSPFKYKEGLTLLESTPADISKMVEEGELTAAQGAQLHASKAILARLVRAGLNVGSVGDNIYADWVQKLPIAGTFNRWLFEKFQRGAMTEGALIEFQRQQKMHPELTADQVARLTAKAINIRFGNLNAQSFLKSRFAGDLMRLVFLAPQWNESLLRSEYEAVKDTLKMVKSATIGDQVTLSFPPVIDMEGSGTPEDPITRRKRRLVIGTLGRAVVTAFIGQFIANQILNFITRGHPTWENPEEGEEAKLSAYIPDVIGNGPGFFLNPMTLPAEMTHLIMKGYHRTGRIDLALLEAFKSRLSSFGRFADVMIEGKNGEGERATGAMNRLGLAVGDAAPLPIGAQAPSRMVASLATGENKERYPGQFQRQIFATFGAKLSSAPSAVQRITALAHEYNQEHGVEDQERMHSPYANLDNYIKVGNLTAAREAMADLLETRTPEQIAQRYKQRAAGRFTGAVEREKDFKRSLNPEQRQQYEQALRDREAIEKEVKRLLAAAPRALAH